MPFTLTRATSILTSNIASSYYIGLSTTTPNSEGGNFSEPSASTGYARQKIGELNASDGEISNKYIIFMFEAVDDIDDDITYFGVFSTATATTPHFYGALSTKLSVPSGYVPLIRAGDLVVTLS